MLRLSSALTVCFWFSAWLAWQGLEAEMSDAFPREAERVWIDPPTANPPSATPSKSSPPATQLAMEIGLEDIAAGDALLRGSETFPILNSSYSAFGSFDAYARAMTNLGARFVVVRQREIVSGVELASGQWVPFAAAQTLSPRARDYSDEAALRGPTERARQEFGNDAGVMMLVPKTLDAGLFGGIASMLLRNGEEPAGFRELRGRYEPGPSGGIRFRVESGVRGDGREVPMDYLFDLRAIAALRQVS